MDELKFKSVIIRDNVSWRENIHAEIIINNRPFAEISEEYERLAYRVSHRKYEKFDYIYSHAFILYRELAEDATCYENPKQKALMICSGCHEPGCAGLWVTIKQKENEVVWSNINNYQRTTSFSKHPVDYSVFPVYHFEKNSYQDALEKLKTIALKQIYTYGMSYLRNAHLTIKDAWMMPLVDCTLVFTDKGSEISISRGMDVLPTKYYTHREAWLLHKEFIDIHVESWDAEYVPKDVFVCDGISWELSIQCSDSIKFTYSGDNAYPDNWNMLLDFFGVEENWLF